jgi:hypothetical protein
MADFGKSNTVDRGRKAIGRAERAHRLSARAVAAALVVAGALGSMPAEAESTSRPSPQVKEVGSKVLALDPSRGSGVYPVYASVDLQVGTAAVRQAIVIIHGRLRNASDYFATGHELVDKAGPAGQGTVVVAPQLLNQVDVSFWGLADRYLRWDRDWEQGNPAQGPSPASSYDVLDDVVAKLSNASAFPELRRIVFVGHGGGAQMLARYAVVMRPQSGPAISFVIANPGTYLYLTAARPVPSICRDFNDWKYGLSSPPPYVGDPAKLIKDFAARDVTLLLGADDKKATGVLDQSCAAKAQGHNRIKRGRYFVDALAASGLAPRLKHAILKGIGHDEQGMLTSDEALKAIFATGNAAR